MWKIAVFQISGAEASLQVGLKGPCAVQLPPRGVPPHAQPEASFELSLGPLLATQDGLKIDAKIDHSVRVGHTRTNAHMHPLA